MFNRIFTALLLIWNGRQQIAALQPGQATALPPGRFSEGNTHYTFFITVQRDTPPETFTPPIPNSVPRRS